MADLDIRIKNSYDTTRRNDVGDFEPCTVYQFMAGRFGPYEISVPRGADGLTVRAEIDKRVSALIPLV